VLPNARREILLREEARKFIKEPNLPELAAERQEVLIS
jgi:hypothetical protein